MSRVWEVFFLCVLVLVAGCSTAKRSDRDEIIARLLAGAEGTVSSESVSSAVLVPDGPDAPDRPMAPVPLISSVTADDASVAMSGASDVRSAASDVSFKSASRAVPEITIQPDCIVQIGVAEDPGLDDNYPVNEIGAVDLKYIGPVILINKTEEEAALKISQVLIGREFRRATVKVKIIQASYDKIRVAGAVERSGLIKIGAGGTISLNDALLRAGGIRASVKGAKIRIIRDGLLSAVGDALKGEEYSLIDENGVPHVPNVTLRNNDVAIVFASEAKALVEGGEKEILVVGEVNKPGIYRFSGDEPCTIMHLIFKMGGLPPYANRKAISIIRRNEFNEEAVIEVNVEKILKEGRTEDDVSLENGDRVVVPARRISLF